MFLQSEVKDMQRKFQQRLQEKEKELQEVKQAVKTLKVSSEQRSAGAAISQLSQTLLQSDSEETSAGHLETLHRHSVDSESSRVSVRGWMIAGV